MTRPNLRKTSAYLQRLNRPFAQPFIHHLRPLGKLAGTLAVVLGLNGCATPKAPVQPAHKKVIHAVTASNQLIRFNAAQPDGVVSAKPIVGLQPGETLVGIDYRVAKGMLYGIGSTSRLYLIDTATALDGRTGIARVAGNADQAAAFCQYALSKAQGISPRHIAPIDGQAASVICHPPSATTGLPRGANLQVIPLQCET